MAAPRPTAAEREREKREEAQRRTRLSLRLGTLGVVVLFLGGVATFFWIAYTVEFLAVMVVGVLLILAAFILVRGSILSLRVEDETKIY